MNNPKYSCQRCAMISPALRELIDARKAQFPSALLDRLDCANPEVRILPHSMAPPPPPEEIAATNPHSASRGMDFIAALIHDSAKQAQKRAELAAAVPKRKPHPNKTKNAPPCPHCGSSNTWSKYKSSSGRLRRICKEKDCGRPFTYDAPMGAA